MAKKKVKRSVKKPKKSNRKTQKINNRVLTPFASTSTNDNVHPPIIVGVVHAEWCGYCKALMDENSGAWPKFIEDMKSRKDVEIHTIDNADIDKNEKLDKLNALIGDGDNKIQVNGFPTIFKIDRGKYVPYTGGRTVEELNEFTASPVKIGGRKKNSNSGAFGFRFW